MLKKIRFSILLIAALLLLQGCYRRESPTPDGWIPTEQQMDSISFYTTHHYSQNYNFVVVADSMQLVVQQPFENASAKVIDTVTVRREDRVVVADIITLPNDTVDSVWVQVARDELTIGWIRETFLLQSVAPDNPISRFIDDFSDTHLLIMLAFVVICVALYVVSRLYRNNAKIVHFRDIDSFYPTLLALLVSASAVFYSTIQLAAPDSWRHYYYHPTLNPFAAPLHLSVFIVSVWGLLLISLAAVDDIRRHLSLGETILYGLGLMGVCAINYVVFSISTLYYIGYPLLILYAYLAIRQYVHKSRAAYFCGRCGEKLYHKGVCPHCGAINE